ncbi:hypothetical protein FB45DRAFT_745052, partial [Roridomyces roridus]
SMERPILPVELLAQCFSLMEPEDLLRCGAFTLELRKRRMVSLLPPNQLPYSTRLKLLRDRERSWRSPQHWGSLQKLSLSAQTGTVYEFAGGYYANGREDENKITSAISFFELPSTESDAPRKTWVHPMNELKIVDFTMDPAQDLLVLVALSPPQCESVYQVHLRSFTTNESMGVLPCLPKISDHHVPLETTGAVRVQVMKDFVALLVKEVHDSVSAHLQIWNWRHGSNYSCAMARMAGIEDFTFLSEDTFLIVRPSGRFECYTFENPVSGSTVPTLKSSYNLPQLQDGYMYWYVWYICMSNNPAPGYVPGELAGNRVYYPRPDERILACCLYIFKPTGPGDHHVHSFVFFLNINTFLDDTPPSSRPDLPDQVSPSNSPGDCQIHPFQLFSPHPSFFTPVNMQQQLAFPPPPTAAAITRSRQMHLRSLLVSSSVQTIPWEQWGPQNTRWFDETLSTDWQHALYGLKTVECIDPFNPIRLGPINPGDVQARLDAMEDEADEPPTVDTSSLPTVNDLLTGNGFDVDDDSPDDHGGRQHLTYTKRHLRIRDYNPYSLRTEEDYGEGNEGKGKEKLSFVEQTTRWRWKRRIVNSPSTTPSRGVFVKDIVSALPYSEVISESKFDVTDVMMDDSRILLMQRGKGGRLKAIDILTM